MDAGEGQNGKCDDCISGETQRQENEKKGQRNGQINKILSNEFGGIFKCQHLV